MLSGLAKMDLKMTAGIANDKHLEPWSAMCKVSPFSSVQGAFRFPHRLSGVSARGSNGSCDCKLGHRFHPGATAIRGSGVDRIWIGYGSDADRTDRTWIGCGSDVDRTWIGRIGRGSDVDVGSDWPGSPFTTATERSAGSGPREDRVLPSL